MRCLIPALLCLASSASAQPASDLLQSGIYHQDTLGDLDAAIRIYRQILSSGAGVRLYTAQAQYRRACSKSTQLIGCRSWPLLPQLQAHAHSGCDWPAQYGSVTPSLLQAPAATH